MSSPNLIILYVEQPLASAAFYNQLLERPVVESSPTFALLALEGGLMLGLWERSGVEPAVDATAGASEIAFKATDQAAVDAWHADWRARGLTILQAPTVMDFGYTFTAADPDGHRLRVFTPVVA